MQQQRLPHARLLERGGGHLLQLLVVLDELSAAERQHLLAVGADALEPVGRGDVAERWELYVDGLELANCFTELCDPAEQRQRFEAARQERRQLGESDYPIDESFLSSLGSIGSAAGVALGVDRLVMTLLGASSIDAVRCGL